MVEYGRAHGSRPYIPKQTRCMDTPLNKGTRFFSKKMNNVYFERSNSSVRHFIRHMSLMEHVCPTLWKTCEGYVPNTRERKIHPTVNIIMNWLNESICLHRSACNWSKKFPAINSVLHGYFFQVSANKTILFYALLV